MRLPSLKKVEEIFGPCTICREDNSIQVVTTNPGKVFLLEFYFNGFWGCCGIGIVHEVYAVPKFPKDLVVSLIHEYNNSMHGYGLLLISDVTGDPRNQDEYEDWDGWQRTTNSIGLQNLEALTEFRNPNSGNDVTLYRLREPNEARPT